MAYYYGAGQTNGPPLPLQQTTMTTVVRDRPRWSWCSTGWSAVTLWLCCPLFGFIGLLCGVLSYIDHKSGDFDRSESKRKCSWGWGMSGFILGLIFLIIIIVVYAVYWKEIVNSSYNSGY